jgi:outer membrane immunogenic protein
MKKSLMIGTALGALIAAPAFAADMPLKARPYAEPVPVFSWTGCYVGVHAGFGAMHDSWTDENGNGGLAGGQVGCNYQSGMLVVGIEGEAWWSGLRTKFNSHDTFGSLEERTKNKWDYTVAGRFGVALDRTFIYGKAGWAWGRFDFDGIQVNDCEGSCTSTASARATLNGALLGAGIEHALTSNWTAKIEYNFINYGSRDVTHTVTDPFDSFTFVESRSAQKHIIKLGANYKF